MIKICIQGHPEKGKEIVNFFKNIGAKNTELWRCNTDLYYCLNDDNNIITTTTIPDGYTLITLPLFPRILWCWNNNPKTATQWKVIGYQPTDYTPYISIPKDESLEYITKYTKFKNASFICPNDSITISIEDAIKILSDIKNRPVIIK